MSLPSATIGQASSVDFDRLVFDDVSRYFGRRRALAHVSFESCAGEVVGLVGPNGAGKSTVLALAATTLQASSGQVCYGDRSAAELGPALRGRVGLLAHELQLYPELTARENLEFFAALFGLDRVAERSVEALERAGLGSRADDPVSGFSRGMRQRVALERALLHDPTLLLLDEPFTGLDEASAEVLIERLRTLKAAGRIVLLTTHDFENAEAVVDRVMLLKAGRVAAIDSSTGSLRDRYRHAMRGEAVPGGAV
ncbi:MAG: ABC transporter ATP-binding protein [Vicinamibacterales bacterium]|nr:ABC transporter ATP-binding protein [Acidobacteriota bacterium]MDP7294159.1 ABC transporter ATP-binding protein [Vicinamibacterales bacterium]MDP7472720.1 ABC transporter ATP-binding protein [Vicinamibacterales bacterium]MDP7671600.1 ABC transporter ATP-binding protein [Vicinamibacterales bacterium]HJO38602.1 ABC transporter ATP-binding protein [Vicinamibacterales bacterium]